MLHSGQRVVSAVVLVFSAVKTKRPAEGPHQAEDVAIVKGWERFAGLLARCDAVSEPDSIGEKEVCPRLTAGAAGPGWWPR